MTKLRKKPIELGKFNTHTGALKNRIDVQSKYGTADFETWVLNNVDARKGMKILDLGAGTGKFSIPLAKKVGIKGKIFSFDLEKKSLQELKINAIGRGLTKIIKIIKGDLNDLNNFFERDGFDKILGSFSLYYTNNCTKLFKTLYQILVPQGELFYCGPAFDNNLELRTFHFALLGQKPPLDLGAGTFMESAGLKEAKKFFGKPVIKKFKNKIRFDSPEALYTYWSSYNLYDSKLDKIFKKKANAYFEKNTYFETTKRVMGIKFIKQRE